VNKKLTKLARVLDLCRRAINSSDPSSVDSLIDDEGLIEKAAKLVEEITGERPADISVLEALNGLSYFVGRYSDNTGKYELKFISCPVAVVIVRKGRQTKVFTANGETHAK
jgi:hypothetical protein